MALTNGFHLNMSAKVWKWFLLFASGDFFLSLLATHDMFWKWNVKIIIIIIKKQKAYADSKQ